LPLVLQETRLTPKTTKQIINNKFFNTKVSKTEIYVPKTYDKLIEIKNNYGNIEIGEFENSTISIEEDYGNVKVENAKDITMQNNYGDISLGDAESATLNESCGDIKIKKVKNFFRDGFFRRYKRRTV